MRGQDVSGRGKGRINVSVGLREEIQQQRKRGGGGELK